MAGRHGQLLQVGFISFIGSVQTTGETSVSVLEEGYILRLGTPHRFGGSPNLPTGSFSPIRLIFNLNWLR